MWSVSLDETGNVYGRLTVKGPAKKLRGRQAWWLCQCACGNTKIVVGTNLRKGLTKSCGCIKLEQTTTMGKENTTHGHTRHGILSREFNSWRAMLMRCTDVKHHAYLRYGGANPPVKVYKQWLQFENFLKDMGNRPENTSLGRFKDMGDYKPSNCKWMTRAEQGLEMRKRNGIFKTRTSVD